MAGWRRWAAIAAVVVLLVAVGSYVVRDLAEPGTASVVTAVAKPGMVDSQPGGLGRIQATVEYDVEFDLPGVSAVPITAVDVIVGSQVTQGEPLLNLDPTNIETHAAQIQEELDGAHAQLAADQASLAAIPVTPDITEIQARQAEVATRQAELTQTEDSGIGGGLLQAAQLALQEAQVGLSQAQSLLTTTSSTDLAQRATLQQAIVHDQDDVTFYTQLASVADGESDVLTSPVSGSVERVNAIPGELAQPGAALVTIVDASQVRVEAEVPLAQRLDVHVGEPATITVSGISNLTLNGSVVAVSPTADSNGLESGVVVQAPNTPNQEALVGAYGQVHVQGSHSAAVTIPTIALLNPDIDPTVFVVKNGRAERVTVIPGDVGTSNVEILSGISDGQVVVVAGAQSLSNGQKVRVSS